MPLLTLLFLAQAAPAADRFTVLHTNDWQSRLLGFGPNADYTPETTGDDATVGGVARLKTLVDRRRAAAAGPSLLLDGGDVLMGTLFHTVTRETGTEFQLMAMIGYDGVTLGNHEFDFRPAGLASSIRAARRREGAPPLIASNVRCDPADPRDDDLEALFEAGVIAPWRVVERGGLRFGIFGVMGTRAYEVIGAVEPVTIADPIAVAGEMVALLRGEQAADVVIMLSHSGVEIEDDGSWGGPEVEYMRAVPGIDVLVGGHSHIALGEPVLVDGRPVLQAGSDGRYLGELVMSRAGDGWAVDSYRLIEVDDELPGDEDVSAVIDAAKEEVTERVLSDWGYTFDQVVAASGRDLTRDFDDHALGNLVTDGLRVAAGADVAITGNGTIRADVLAGERGLQRVSDLFRIAGLGIGEGDTPGYAVAKMYFTGAELKSIFEFLLIGYQLKGDSYYPRVSGVQVVYNNRRVPFDRVSEIRLGDDERGYNPIELDDSTLYALATTTYVAGFLPTIEETSFGLLKVTPKDADGNPTTDIQGARVDADPRAPGLQEVKAWRAVMDRFAALPDPDEDGVPDVPAAGGDLDAERLVRADSLAPTALFKNATAKMGCAALSPLPLGFLIGSVVGWRRRRRAGG